NDTFMGPNAANEYIGGDGADQIDFHQYRIPVYIWVPAIGRWVPSSIHDKDVHVTLDDQSGDGFFGADNVHSDIEQISGTLNGDTLIAGNTAVSFYGSDG